MNSSDHERLGRALASILESVSKIIEPGKSLLEIAEAAEDMIRSSGFKPAFPANISVGRTAAHYTPPPGDGSVVPEDGLIKIDLGLRDDRGLIVDAARSIGFGPSQGKMIEAAKSAVEAAARSMKPGTRISKVSSEIYRTIRSAGFKPVENLSGHKIEPFRLHAGVSVPNVPSITSRYKLRPGDVFAVEPFVVPGDAAGFVVESPPALIFSLRRKIRTRNLLERKILEAARVDFAGLPFCERWLIQRGERLSGALERLVRIGALDDYPPLVEFSGRQVAQWENTILVTEDGGVVLTE